MLLSRMVFFSRNAAKSGENASAMIKSILQACSEYSPSSGLTGGLVFNERYFLQVTEGARDQLTKKLKTLMADEKQTDLTLLSMEPIDQRDFDGWAVGYAGRATDAERLYLKYSLSVDLDPTRISHRAAHAFVHEFCTLDTFYVQRTNMTPKKETGPLVERIKVSGPAQAAH